MPPALLLRPGHYSSRGREERGSIGRGIHPINIPPPPDRLPHIRERDRHRKQGGRKEGNLNLPQEFASVYAKVDIAKIDPCVLRSA